MTQTKVPPSAHLWRGSAQVLELRPQAGRTGADPGTAESGNAPAESPRFWCTDLFVVSTDDALRGLVGALALEFRSVTIGAQWADLFRCAQLSDAEDVLLLADLEVFPTSRTAVAELARLRRARPSLATVIASRGFRQVWEGTREGAVADGSFRLPVEADVLRRGLDAALATAEARRHDPFP